MMTPEPGQNDAVIGERMRQLMHRLESLAQEQVTKRQPFEDRWVKELRQFYGRYDQQTEKNLSTEGASRLFVGATRKKTNAWAARLSDLLFPTTNDDNWDIKATPVPDMPATQVQGDGQAEANADANADANARAEKMKALIRDQLKEAQYASECRKVIRDACRIGTGILEGPVLGGPTRRSWQVADESGEYRMTAVSAPRPIARQVDVWGFFPDMDAASVDEAEFFFERFLPNRRDLRRMARETGFDMTAVRTLLRDGPAKDQPAHIAKLREISEDTHRAVGDRYQVWKYHGMLEGQEIRDICCVTGRDDWLEDIDDDPMAEMNVVIWFAQGQLLKFGLYHLDSGDPVYSVFNLEPDDTSIFGYGVPHLIGDSQRALNSAWRMMMDNAGISVGPQVVVNTSMIVPQNGSYALTPLKLWEWKQGANPAVPPFQTYHIESQLGALEHIIGLARQFIDDDSNLPLIVEGEGAAHITQTAHGMSMLMNAANIMFRDVVKSFDDKVTTPIIRRFYDFNMQFADDDGVRGDFEVEAIGSSVFLVREMQSQNLMSMAANFSAHPVLGPLLKTDAVLRLLAQSLMLPADQVVKTMEEIAQEQQQLMEQQGEAGAVDPETMKLQAAAELKQAELQQKAELQAREHEMKMTLAAMERDTALIKLAGERDMDLAKLRAMIAGKEMDIASKERLFAGEVAVKDRHGEGI